MKHMVKTLAFCPFYDQAQGPYDQTHGFSKRLKIAKYLIRQDLLDGWLQN
jgi:hypothetical protein